MLNQVYINDFEASYYKHYLNNPNYLSIIKSEYLKQYADNSDALFLAFKESLDHYVLQQILKDENYINSTEFQNYLNYIMHIVEEKRQNVEGKIYNIELSTNVVFRNDYIRRKVFNRYYNEKTINLFENHINSTKKHINTISGKMVNRERISQDEINLVSDYIYSSRNFNNNIGKIYAEYIFNEITTDSNIKMSIPMLGALTSYFTQYYSADNEVKNSRTFIAEFDNKKEDLAHKSGTRRYCYFSKKYFGKTSLIKDDSLDTSRIIYSNHEDVDIYHLLMIAYHELTHDHQHNEGVKDSLSSSGMAYIVKDILNKNLNGYVRLDKNGNPINITEYNVNHDSTEYEIQADEEAWRQCRNFIATHCRQYAYKHHLDSSIAISREDKCYQNEQNIRARRAFSLKKDSEGKTLYYSLYDIKNLVAIIRENSSILEKYPTLKAYLDLHGNLDTSILFTRNITSKDNSGLNVDNTGLEFATYMLDFETDKILEKISSGELVEEQILNLILNIYNVMHQNVLKIRDFAKTDKKDYSKTTHNFDLEKKSDMIYNYFFEKNASEIYNAMEILSLIKRNYPQFNASNFDDTNHYISYFYELLSKAKNINLDKIQAICDKYDNSRNPILLELSDYMKINILDLYGQYGDSNAITTDTNKRI